MLVAVVKPEQLAVVEPVLLPAGRRVSPHQRDRMASELACRTSEITQICVISVLLVRSVHAD